MNTYLPHAFTPEPTLDLARLPASLQAHRRRWQTRLRAVFGMWSRSEAGSALIMVHQIDQFCVPQLADTECLEADHNGG